MLPYFVVHYFQFNAVNSFNYNVKYFIVILHKKCADKTRRGRFYDHFNPTLGQSILIWTDWRAVIITREATHFSHVCNTHKSEVKPKNISECYCFLNQSISSENLIKHNDHAKNLCIIFKTQWLCVGFINKLPVIRIFFSQF